MPADAIIEVSTDGAPWRTTHTFRTYTIGTVTVPARDNAEGTARAMCAALGYAGVSYRANTYGDELTVYPL